MEFSNFRALEEHFRERHPGLDCKPLCHGTAAHGYYLSFSGHRLRDIWAMAESKKSETPNIMELRNIWAMETLKIMELAQTDDV